MKKIFKTLVFLGSFLGRQHPRLRSSVRTANKPLQREDLHHHLVLAHLRGTSVNIRTTTLAVVLTSLEPHQLPQKVPQTHGPSEPREVRQEDVQDIRRAVSQARRRSRLTTHRKEL